MGERAPKLLPTALSGALLAAPPKWGETDARGAAEDSSVTPALSLPGSALYSPPRSPEGIQESGMGVHWCVLEVRLLLGFRHKGDGEGL